MKKIFYIVLGVLIIFHSCKARKSVSSNDNQEMMADISKDTLVKENTPKIISLPFGPNINTLDYICSGLGAFYYDMIWENLANGDRVFNVESFSLPQIDSFKYVTIDSSLFSPTNLDKYFKLSKYTVQLPDLGNLKIYYVSGYYSKDPYLKYYPGMEEYDYYNYYGFLVVFNKTNRSANVFCIFYTDHSIYREADYSRRFFVDKNYNIFICDLRLDDGYFLQDFVEGSIESKIHISLFEDSTYKINRLNEFPLYKKK